MNIICSNCHTENSSEASVCRHCGRPLRVDAHIPVTTGIADTTYQKREVDKSTKVLTAIIVFIGVLIVILVAVFISVSLGDDTGDNSAETVDTVETSDALSAEDDGSMITGANDLPAGEWGEYIAVESISLSRQTLELEEGETYALDYAINPEDATVQSVYWDSSNYQVATVSEGVITAVSSGTAYIYVYSADDGKAQSRCEVVVKSKDKLIEPSSTSDYGEHVVTVENSAFLSLRYGPSIEYGEIDRIDNGEIVRVYSFANDEEGRTWAYVKYKRTYGWVYSDFLISRNQTTERTTEATTDADDEDFDDDVTAEDLRAEVENV